MTCTLEHIQSGTKTHQVRDFCHLYEYVVVVEVLAILVMVVVVVEVAAAAAFVAEDIIIYHKCINGSI